MNRRAFLFGLMFILTTPVKALSSYQEKSDISKIIELVKKTQQMDVIINNKLYRGFELPIKDQIGVHKYVLQVYEYLKDKAIDVEKSYFAIINYEKKHFLFDFGLNRNVDIYIGDQIINTDSIMEMMDDAVHAYENKSSKNKNLKMITTLEDEANKTFRDDLNELSHLLNI